MDMIFAKRMCGLVRKATEIDRHVFWRLYVFGDALCTDIRLSGTSGIC